MKGDPRSWWDHWTDWESPLTLAALLLLVAVVAALVQR